MFVGGGGGAVSRKEFRGPRLKVRKSDHYWWDKSECQWGAVQPPTILIGNSISVRYTEFEVKSMGGMTIFVKPDQCELSQYILKATLSHSLLWLSLFGC